MDLLYSGYTVLTWYEDQKFADLKSSPFDVGYAIIEIPKGKQSNCRYMLTILHNCSILSAKQTRSSAARIDEGSY